MIGNNGRGLVLQERDRHLMRELSVMRVIDREQVQVVAGFHSVRRANDRLLALTRAGTLRRFFLGTTGSGKKAVYGLSKKGAESVDVPNRGPRRKRDETLASDAFVQHQLAVNQAYCWLKYRHIPIDGTRFIRWLPFFAPPATGIALIPDGYFEIATNSDVMSSFLEVDLGNEGLNIWKAKVQAYLQIAMSGEFERRFHQPRFRVLVLTNSERRLQSIRKFVATITERLFWFATFESVHVSGLWSPVWFRPKGDTRYSLL